MDALKSPSAPTDIFSLSDQALSDSLQFLEEIGFGNWGSVWLCRPKSRSHSRSSSTSAEQKIAVKLVHRSKTTTTAARVRSLWNEMKIVRSFKSDPHPSIIPFHSFIVTPSYALITMAYLPTLVPVEVDETKACEWFRFLLSGVEFLHHRGVVHNDIKPANILLSPKNVPVLVDFGFAEKYDPKSAEAFRSNLSYGTPEYLSPERARGLSHDTRKSDVWSLGITFFEILIGRTPFEETDGEQLTTREELERYWERTLRGQWVGTWKMSPGMEKMLRKMIVSNADLRWTASQVMVDPYWEVLASHKRSSSYSSSIVFEKDLVRLMREEDPPSMPELKMPHTPPGLSPAKSLKEAKIQQLTKSRSHPKGPGKTPTPRSQPRRRIHIADLTPIKGSPRSSPLTGKENIKRFNVLASSASGSTPRRPLGALGTLNTPPRSRLDTRSSASDLTEKRKSRAVGQSTTPRKDKENSTMVTPVKSRTKAVVAVRDRVKEWEREKERLREMSRLEEIEKERDEMIRQEKQMAVDVKAKDKDIEEVRRISGSTSTAPSLVSPAGSFFSTDSSEPLRTPHNSSLNVFKHQICKPIDKTPGVCKNSQGTGRSTPALALTTEADEDISRRAIKEASEDDILCQEISASFVSMCNDDNAIADMKMDRMAVWMRNVEKVVEDARLSFASSSTHQLVYPSPLPIAPLSSKYRASRRQRRIPTVNEIFADGNGRNISDVSARGLSDGPNLDRLMIPGPITPSRQRRATVSECSPDKAKRASLDLLFEPGTPKRREKSKSHSNLNVFQRHITPPALIERELDKSEVPTSSHRLSEVLDSSLFFAPRRPSACPTEAFDAQDPVIEQEQLSIDDLTSSPLHVEPYPQRKLNGPIPDLPSQRRLESVYDRFLMATSGVKRLGKGYQSENVAPITNTLNTASKPRSRRVFSGRRPMTARRSIEQISTVSVDELGTMASTDSGLSRRVFAKDDDHTTVALVRRAIKAIVPGKTTKRSRMVS